MSDSNIEQLRRGSFACVHLRGGPVISGYAATDPEDARFVRLDSLVSEDDGSLSQISLRLSADNIESVKVLSDAPRFRNADGLTVVMPASLWLEAAE